MSANALTNPIRTQTSPGPTVSGPVVLRIDRVARRSFHSAGLSRQNRSLAPRSLSCGRYAHVAQILGNFRSHGGADADGKFHEECFHAGRRAAHHSIWLRAMES